MLFRVSVMASKDLIRSLWQGKTVYDTVFGFGASLFQAKTVYDTVFAGSSHIWGHCSTKDCVQYSLWFKPRLGRVCSGKLCSIQSSVQATFGASLFRQTVFDAVLCSSHVWDRSVQADCARYMIQSIVQATFAVSLFKQRLYDTALC